jgi:hypothetical protein
LCYNGNRTDAIETGDYSIRAYSNLCPKDSTKKFVRSFTNYTPNQGLASDYILSILEDRIGNLWFGTYNGVSRYDGNRVEAIERGDTITANNKIEPLKTKWETELVTNLKFYRSNVYD